MFTGEVIGGNTTAARSVSVDIPAGFEPAAVWMKEAWDSEVVLYSISLNGGRLDVCAFNPSDAAMHLDCLIEILLRPV